ncbi:MAG: divalent-cation tolerance protein CutA [Planctomycetaceae bacterium]|nr:divalent-cation tolerance protein CutA [Planctomycetales bacterium]MCB9925771.1 divalent-cation tolerance protein CutA [Planctomycetaceae bacterium]
MTGIIQITTTVADQADAERIAAALVAKELAACVQVSGPIESTYRWKDQIETSQEWVCAIKTREELFDEVEQAIRDLHSYEEPEIMAVAITSASSGYRDWILASVKA